MTEQQVKAAVRRRDGFRCTHCGMTNATHLRRYRRCLQVHRKRPGSRYNVAGCQTVCIPCHGPLPRRAPGERIKEIGAAGGAVPLGVEISAALYDALDKCRRAKKWSKRSAVEEALRDWLTKEGVTPPPEDA